MSEAGAQPKLQVDETKYRGVVYNACYGGFDINEELKEIYFQRTGLELTRNVARDDPDFVFAVKTVKDTTTYDSATNLEIAYIDKRYHFKISEYDGQETVEKGKVIGCKCRCTCLDSAIDDGVIKMPFKIQEVIMDEKYWQNLPHGCEEVKKGNECFHEQSIKLCCCPNLSNVLSLIKVCKNNHQTTIEAFSEDLRKNVKEVYIAHYISKVCDHDGVCLLKVLDFSDPEQILVIDGLGRKYYIPFQLTIAFTE